jgi:cytochrome c oxidase cbb3-type subunit IV
VRLAMSYEQVASVSQVVALIFFVVLFAGVLLYAFWPGNKKRFEEAARLPLEKDPDGDEDEKDG